MAEKSNVLPTEFDTLPTFEQLAEQQGVCLVEDLASILGLRHPDDGESADNFLTLLREWRREGSDQNRG